MASVLAKHYSANGQRVVSPRPPPIHLESGGDPFAGHMLFPTHKPGRVLSKKPQVSPPRFKSLPQTRKSNVQDTVFNLVHANRISEQFMPKIVPE